MAADIWVTTTASRVYRELPSAINSERLRYLEAAWRRSDLIVVDEAGRKIDGDQLMALVARSWHQAGRLAGGGVVATIMSNLGLERFLDGLGLTLARTPVGDRYVVEHMREHGFNVGGEQSGHIVLADYGTTGDGLVAALQVLAAVRAADRPVSEIARAFEPVPQLLRNVRYKGGDPLSADSVQAAIADARSRLGKGGRLVIRKSGTEPLVRVMAEGDDADLVGIVVADVVDSVERAANRSEPVSAGSHA